MGGAAKSITGIGGAAKGLFGSSSDPGLLGTGQFKGEKYRFDDRVFKDNERDKESLSSFEREVGRARARRTPQSQAAKINAGPQNEMRGRQTALLGDLERASRGEGPSVAQDQLDRATGQNIAQAMALQASQRGRNAGASMRSIQRSTDAAQQNAARDAASMRIQEQLAARDQLGGLASQARGQDMAFANQQAAMQQQTNMANQQAALQARSQNDALSSNALQNQAAIRQNMDQKLMDLEKLRGQQSLGVQNVNAQGFAGAAQRRGDMIGGIGGALAALSDETKKKNINELSFDNFMKGASLDKNQSKINDAPPLKTKSDEKIDQSPEKYSVDKDASGHSQMGQIMGQGLSSLLSSTSAGGSAAAAGGAAAGGASAAGGAAAMSDKDNKKDIEAPSEKKVQSFLDALKAYEYEYKEPGAAGAGEGKHISPMAQDLEKSELGKTMVEDTPDGKMVNYAKSGGLMLATAAMLNEKMESLEDKLKKAWDSKKGAN